MMKKTSALILTVFMLISMMSPIASAVAFSEPADAQEVSDFAIPVDIASEQIDFYSEEPEPLSLSDIATDELYSFELDLPAGSFNIATFAGQFTINENLIYTHGLTSATDWNIYICQMTTTGDATAFLRSSSTMNFNMIVQVYDSSLSVLLSEDESHVDRSIYGGQYIRKGVSAGQFLVIYVEQSGSAFAANSYEVGVVRQTRITNDSYEPNNHPDRAANFGVIPVEGILNSSSTIIDSAFDVDWYRFDYTAACTRYFPRFAFIGENDIKATLYRRASNGDMIKVTDLTNDGSWSVYANDTVQTYYIAVYSPSRSTGTYAMGIGLREIFVHERRVYVSFVNLNGDRPSKDYGKGTYPVVARFLTGTVKVVDSRGNPVPDFPVIVDFVTFSPPGSGSIARTGDFTGANGTFYLNLEIPVWPCQNEVVGVVNFFRYYMKPYEVYRNYAEIRVTVADGYANSGTTRHDVYQYGAEFWIG